MKERYDLENTKGWLIDQIKDCENCEDLDALILDCAEDIDITEGYEKPKCSVKTSTSKKGENNGE